MKEQQMSGITPFRIAIPEADIADLKERLAMTRWPVPVTEDWSRGQPVHFIRELAEQWQHRYDWRAHEAELNRQPHFLTEIDGQAIHFVHVRSAAKNALPLILTHGWPSTFYEYYPLIELLAGSFDLVIPSLPGYGFSKPLAGPGWGSIRTARAWDTLMRRLGYERYGAIGNDVGALVTKELGTLAPAGLAGIHLQQIFAFPKGEPGEMEKLSPFEREGFANLDRFQKYAAYQAIQQKRPATLGFGLTDSPAALAAWNAELHFGFEGEMAAQGDRERYLTHLSLYWFTATGGSATNFYYEDAQDGGGYREATNPTPTAVASFPWDFRSVRSFSERANNIVHWTEMPRGGHFAAMDEPGLLAADIGEFFRAVI